MSQSIHSPLLAIAAALFITGAAAGAQAHEGRQHPRLPISLETVEARVAERFAEADIDGDGLVSSAEFNALEAENPRHRFRGKRGHGPRRWHSDPSDGSEEVAARREEREAIRFDAIDTDDDGQISEAEFAGRRESMKAAHKAQLFARFDANADGQLEIDEFPSRLQRLRELDTDGDGQVTRAEFRARAHHRRADS